MTRAEHLKFCEKCKNRKMDFQQGLICKITDRQADFEETCENFELDESIDPNARSFGEEVATVMSPELFNRLSVHQNLVYAILGGFAIALICALLWAAITVATEFQIAFMAIGVGIAVGLGVRFFGAGITAPFGVVGAVLSLVGCVLGNLFSQVGFIANAEGYGYLETLSLLDWSTMIAVFQESFSPIDLLFYGLAVYEGYKFAFREIPDDIMEKEDLTPAGSSLRLPLVVGSFIMIAIIGYTLNEEAAAEHVFKSESGFEQSKGRLVNGVEDGDWEYYYENGSTMITGNYIEGHENGIWTWYFESGEILKTGEYKNGLVHGEWLIYNEDGTLVESSNYNIGRLQGEIKSYYDTGELSQIGQYDRDKNTGQWLTYDTSGTVLISGSYKKGEMSGQWSFNNEDGTPYEIDTYLDDGTVLIQNYWNDDGKQVVKNGNGHYLAQHPNGTVMQEGNVVNGVKVGDWTNYYSNGQLQEIGYYVNDEYSIKSAWHPNGDVMIENGSGEYISYGEDLEFHNQIGHFADGKQTGTWMVYSAETRELINTSNHSNGKLHGMTKVFFANGNLATVGQYDQGDRSGEWTWYYEFGEKQCTITYENGEKQGDQIFWSESGRLAKKEVYDKGKLISEKLL